MDILIIICLILMIIVLIVGLIIIKRSNDQLTSDNKRLMDQINTNIAQQFANSSASRGKELELIYKVLENADSKQQQQLMDLVKIASSLKTSETTMQSLQASVGSLNKVLNDKKVRGIYGETILSRIYEQVFGTNHQYYDLQVTLSNHTIVDSVVYLPDPLHMVCVDSKFPLENYNRLVECGDEQQLKVLDRRFEADVLKHVQTIATKYIIKDETADFAVMFVPAQSVYDYIVDHYDKVIELSNRYHVVLASPVNLLMLIETMAVLYGKMRQFERSNEIMEQLGKLNDEFDRFKNRWNTVCHDFEKIEKDITNLNITFEKLSNRLFDITDQSANNT